MTKPLTGVRIADFTVHAAGPFCTHMLTQLGAECIKIESRHRPDIFRKPHAVYGRTEAAAFDHVTYGKLSVRLNLKHPKGKELARSLVALSDVAVENFRAGVLSRLGLGWDELSKVKPDLVMVSISSSGQNSPHSGFAGYAPLFGAWGAVGTMSGYQDGPPMEMRHVMDHAAGMYGVMAVLAGLNGRAATGRGGYYDVAARDVASASLGEFLLEAAAGREPTRWGNAHPGMAPHGVYPAAGDDAWITIAVRDDAGWRGLCERMERLELVVDPRFASAAARLGNRTALDELLAAWTRERPAEEIASLLQDAGVAAHSSYNSADIAADVHLRARGTVIDVDLPSGPIPAVRAPMRFSGTEVGAEPEMPDLGGDEDYVFGHLLRLSRADRAVLEEEGAIY